MKSDAPTNNVFVTGAFDDLRSPDVRFLEQAAKSGPVTVLLACDAAIRSQTGSDPKLPEAERKYVLNAIRFVSRVCTIDAKAAGEVLPELPGEEPTCWVLRPAQDSEARRACCASRGVEYRLVSEEELRGFPEIPATPAPAPRKKVVVTGCYDWLHSGHVRFFEEVSRYGDLYVVIGHDANVRMLKGPSHPMHGQEERRYMVASIRYVAQALVSSGNGWLDAEPEIGRLKPDFYAVNDDGDRGGKREFCAAHGIEYLVLKRQPAPGLPRRTSTDLRGY